MTKVMLINDNNVQPLLNRIQELLIKKALREKKPQDEHNKTYLGGVSFWFQRDKNNIENYYLIFTSNPSSWIIEDIINDIENIEYIMFNS